MKKKQLIGLVIFVIIIIAVVGIKFYTDKTNNNNNASGVVDLDNLTNVYVATGGGKEDFIADKDVVNIMQTRYNLNVVYDGWSNGKLIVKPLVREDGSKYNAMFCSDQRFYDYYRLAPDQEKGEADRSRATGVYLRRCAARHRRLCGGRHPCGDGAGDLSGHL